jgi:hypothetical protein
MSFKVKLTYFKPNGKFYSTGSYNSNKEFMFQISDEVAHMALENCLPDLNGPSKFVILIQVPDHPHSHPHLITDCL